ncbi:MAG: helix-turn-helix domain-containing protein [Clostridiaceae bacterium]|nr:helix-turn-helix domain-containing protein [Clostridiaceae bacterium]
MSALGRKTVLKYWLLSYLIILAIPLCVGIPVSFYAASIVNSEVQSAHINSINQVKNYIDNKLAEMTNISRYLCNDERINVLKSISWELEPSHRYMFTAIQKDLATVIRSNDFIDGIFIYYKYNDFILSDSDIYQRNNFEFANRSNFNVESDTFNSMLTRKYKGVGEFVLHHTLDDQGRAATCLLYAISIPTNPLDDVQANLFITVKYEKLLEILSNDSWAKGNAITYFQDDNTHVVNPVFDQYHLNFDTHNYNRNFDIQNIRIDQETYTLSYVKSEVTDGKYVAIIPSKALQQKISKLLWIIYLYIAISVLSGGIFSYYFVRRNYQPIHNLMTTYIPDKGKAKRKFTRNIFNQPNEFNQIDEYIKALTKTNNNEAAENYRRDELVKNNYICNILKGNMHDDSLTKDEIKKLGLDLTSNQFIVALTSVREYQNLFLDNQVSENINYYKTACFIIKNVAQEILSRSLTTITAEIDDTIAFIVCADRKTADCAQNDIYVAFRQSEEVIKSHFSIEFTIAIGNLHDKISGIATSYHEALQVFEYSELTDNTEAVFYNNINDIDKRINHTTSVELEQKLYNSIRAGDYDMAKTYLDQIFTEYFEDHAYSLQLTKCKMFSLINLLTAAIGDMKLRADREFFESVDPVNKLLGCSSVSSLKQVMSDILDMFRQYSQKRDIEMSDKKRRDIMNFIDSHFDDMNLSILEVAMEFNLSTSYLSRLFKQHNNIGFLDYVHKKRISKAKSLLENTQMNLKDIATAAGYGNDIALIRAFKKYEGVTPGKYRSI